jgi:acetylornithine deacetylase/succinyl-diaminopimelate desuccinylase-like protein
MTPREVCRAAIRAGAEELVELTLALSRLPDLAGRERPVAEAVLTWLQRTGIEAEGQIVGPDSVNVLGRVPGSDPTGAPSLAFSAHLDTEGARPAGGVDARRHLRGAWRDADLLIGKGLVNDKVQLAAQMIALRSLRDAGGIPGDLLLAAVAQETGSTRESVMGPGGRRIPRGPHVGEGHGARTLLARGFRADFALIGEPNGFAVGGAQAGVLQLRIDIPGQIVYTPFVRRPADGTTNPFERAGQVLTRLETWCRDYQATHRHRFWGGTVAATAQVLAVQGSAPLYTDADDWCHVFLDVRLLPQADSIAVIDSIRAALGVLPFSPSIVVVDHQTGHIATGHEPLTAALTEAHEAVFGSQPSEPAEMQVSMWQDTNAFNEAGIPALAYGIRTVPEPYTRERFRAVRADDVVALAEVYALTALAIHSNHSPRTGHVYP